MKQNKVLKGSMFEGSFGSHFIKTKNSLIKNFELGILKNGLAIENNNVKKYYYSINTVYRCRNYLNSYFNKMFGSVGTDKRRSPAGNYSNHPKYLECIKNIEAMMIIGYDHGYISGKYQYPELYKGMISLNNHQKSIVLAYFFVINVCV